MISMKNNDGRKSLSDHAASIATPQSSIMADMKKDAADAGKEPDPLAIPKFLKRPATPAATLDTANKIFQQPKPDADKALAALKPSMLSPGAAEGVKKFKVAKLTWKDGRALGKHAFYDVNPDDSGDQRMWTVVAIDGKTRSILGASNSPAAVKAMAVAHETKLRDSGAPLFKTGNESTKAPAKPKAKSKKESKVRTKKTAKKTAARVAVKGKTSAKKSDVDRRPMTVGEFTCKVAGVTMADMEKQFAMDAHPLRAKIHAAKHELGFKIEYDAKAKRYFGTAPKQAKKKA